jgi:menaquinone-9 beta-reductase
LIVSAEDIRLKSAATDVFVIGGGPAGLAAAIAARRKGLDVTVADGASPPIDKACGEGLLPESLAALESLGVAISPGDGHTIRGVRFWNDSSSVEARFSVSGGVGLRRVALHRRMIECAERCGVHLLWNAPVTGIWSDGVELAGQAVLARWIVGADGANSRVRRWAGLGTECGRSCRFGYRRHYRIAPWSDCVEVYWAHDYQLYVTPVAQEEVCVAMLSRKPGNRVVDAIAQVPALAARLADVEPVTPQRGAVTSMCRLANVYRGSVALVGDASGSVDAITGDGLRLAFLQAAVLADALESGDLAAYQSAHREIGRRPRLLARLLLSLGHDAALRHKTIETFAADPALFSRLVSAHAGASMAANLVGAGLKLSWRFLTA